MPKDKGPDIKILRELITESGTEAAGKCEGPAPPPLPPERRTCAWEKGCIFRSWTRTSSEAPPSLLLYLVEYIIKVGRLQSFDSEGLCQVVVGKSMRGQNGLSALKSEVTLFCRAGKDTALSGSARLIVLGRKCFSEVLRKSEAGG